MVPAALRRPSRVATDGPSGEGGPGCPTILLGEGPQSPEEREVSEPSPSPQWFAPDFLIGPSLPFERRATGVAKQPPERQRGGGRAHGGCPESSWPLVLPAAPAPSSPCVPFLLLLFQLGFPRSPATRVSSPRFVWFGFAQALVQLFFFFTKLPRLTLNSR